ncbi:trypsin-like serine peptidase [Gulosibacter sediminis]|uniref:trypsin-like serine peptidase n=1 Tax=Gulosibacter sediminis TaxID=1729695 RepID=UPI001865EE2B|nr:hypothetical protein [Gulosibacter sediminis]
MRAWGRPRGRAVLAAVVALTTAALSGCAVSNIDASSSDNGYSPFLPEVHSDDSGLRQEFEATPQESHEFWSDPERRDNAEGMDYQTPDNGLPPGPGDPATGAYLSATEAMPADPQGYGDVSDAEVFDRAGLGASTFGRLYFTFDGGDTYVCSATVVNSTSGSIIATAAHCAAQTDGSGQLAQSMYFIPGDRDNGRETPYGTWAATEMVVPQQFIDGAITDDSGMLTSEEGWNYDFAFIKLEEQNGQTIQEVTGAQGIAFGVPVDYLTQVGYPSAAPYDGTEEYMCASTQFQSNWQGGYAHSCTMTQGSSGGGWLSDYDATTGTGYLVGVTSTVDEIRGTANTPVLGQTALDLYTDLDER